MAAQRLLAAYCLAALGAVGGAGPVVAQERAEPGAIALPRWVRVSANVGKFAPKITGVIDAASAEAPLGSALKVGDAAVSAANVFHTNARLIGSRKVPPGALAGRYAAGLRTAGQLLGLAVTGYELVNGNLSASQAGRDAVQIGAATAATSLAYAGMIYAAGALGTASTGTAIASLSGAAYTSAATAWYGGGSVAAGGWGMAGGGMVMSGGMLLVAVGAGVAVYKVWGVFDPAERRAMDALAAGLQTKSDLTDPDSALGAALLAQKRRLDQAERRQK